jgi:hypothetical protein
VNTGTLSSRLGVGRKADDFFLYNVIVAKYKEVKTCYNLAESCKEGYGSKRAALSIIIVIIFQILSKSL